MVSDLDNRSADGGKSQLGLHVKGAKIFNGPNKGTRKAADGANNKNSKDIKDVMSSQFGITSAPKRNQNSIENILANPRNKESVQTIVKNTHVKSNRTILNPAKKNMIAPNPASLVNPANLSAPKNFDITGNLLPKSGYDSENNKLGGSSQLIATNYSENNSQNPALTHGPKFINENFNSKPYAAVFDNLTVANSDYLTNELLDSKLSEVKSEMLVRMNEMLIESQKYIKNSLLDDINKLLDRLETLGLQAGEYHHEKQKLENKIKNLCEEIDD